MLFKLLTHTNTHTHISGKEHMNTLPCLPVSSQHSAQTANAIRAQLRSSQGRHLGWCWSPQHSHCDCLEAELQAEQDRRHECAAGGLSLRRENSVNKGLPLTNGGHRAGLLGLGSSCVPVSPSAWDPSFWGLDFITLKSSNTHNCPWSIFQINECVLPLSSVHGNTPRV